MDTFLFFLFAITSIAFAANLVIQPHPIYGAISLIGVMGSLAVLYLLMGGEFIAAAQVIVYAGAVMVLFVFVIMLLNAGREEIAPDPPAAKYLGIPALFVLVGTLAYILWRLLPPGEAVVFGGFTGGTVSNVGKKLFADYVLPFEVTSVLILIAIVGAVILGRKELE